MSLTIPNDFAPRPYQLPFMRYFTDGGSDGRGKRAVWCMHRRAGKDITAMHTTAMLMHRRIGTYWHVFPIEEQGRKAIWTEFRADGKRIMENVFPSWMRKSPRDWSPNAAMIVELKCGSVWRLIGSDKIEVVGAGPVGVTFSEYALAKPSTWELVSPMLRANSGWAAFISTPRGNNHFKKQFDVAGRETGWFRDLKTVFDTGQQYASTRRPGDLIGPEEMLEEERAAGRQEAFLRQEYLCDWTAANIGSVWGDMLEALEKRGGLASFEHPTDGVFTTWDMGISDAMAIWFWRINDRRQPDLIDHYEATGKPLSHFFDEIESRPYHYVKHWLPHDARARTYQTGVSTVEMFQQRFGAEVVALTPELSFADGIQAGRWLLQQPMRIHPRCAAGIEALRAYHYAWDEDAKVLSSKPEHDWSSHTADAFRYVSVIARASEQLTRPPEHEPRGPYARSLDSFSLDELWQDRERARRR